MAVVLVSGLAFVNNVNFGSAQSGLIVFINSDTTWTKANSPYTLTGPIVGQHRRNFDN